MIGRGYTGAGLGSQGHVAIVMPKFRGYYYVLQSYGGYAKWPGLNWSHPLKESHAGGYYTRSGPPPQLPFIRGDEF